MTHRAISEPVESVGGDWRRIGVIPILPFLLLAGCLEPSAPVTELPIEPATSEPTRFLWRTDEVIELAGYAVTISASGPAVPDCDVLFGMSGKADQNASLLATHQVLKDGEPVAWGALYLNGASFQLGSWRSGAIVEEAVRDLGVEEAAGGRWSDALTFTNKTFEKLGNNLTFIFGGKNLAAWSASRFLPNDSVRIEIDCQNEVEIVWKATRQAFLATQHDFDNGTRIEAIDAGSVVRGGHAHRLFDGETVQIFAGPGADIPNSANQGRLTMQHPEGALDVELPTELPVQFVGRGGDYAFTLDRTGLPRRCGGSTCGDLFFLTAYSWPDASTSTSAAQA